MKNTHIAILLFVVTLGLTVLCSQNRDNIEVYSFSGGNDAFAINNGIIIANADTEQFKGGEYTRL